MQLIMIFIFTLIGTSCIFLLYNKLSKKHTILFSIIFCTQLYSAIILLAGYLIGNAGMSTGTVAVAALLCLGGICLTIYSLYRLVVRPLLSVGIVLKSISEGSGNLTKNIEYAKQNEIGSLAGSFNSFISSLNCTITSIKRLTGENLGVSERLAKASELASTALKQISSNTDAIKEQTSSLDGAINESNNTIVEFREFLQTVVDKITDQASEINESTSSIEEITRSIENTSTILKNNLTAARELESLAEDGSMMMNDTLENIRKISGATEIINETLETISSIGIQTNLLAMNAAIEAAHAGNAGRGFSVVADEIRKLAEESSTKAAEITISLKEITSNILVTEDSSRKSEQIFGQIVNRINSVNTGIMEVENSMSELTKGSGLILVSLGALVENTSNIKESSTIMTDKVQEIVESDLTIAGISGNIKNDITGIASGIKDLSASLEKVSRSGAVNAKNVARIEKLTNSFEV